MIICLVSMLPSRSSDLPVHQTMRITSLDLFGLASGGVYRFFMFPKRFVVSYTTFSPLPWYICQGGFFSVALSISSRIPCVTGHHILRCSDFPLSNYKSSLKSNHPIDSIYNNLLKLINWILIAIYEPTTNITPIYSIVRTNFGNSLHCYSCPTTTTRTAR